MIKGLTQEDITFVNMHAPNIGVSQYIKTNTNRQKGEIDSNTIIVGDFNIPLTSMDITCRQKINKQTQDLNDILDHMKFIDIHI